MSALRQSSPAPAAAERAIDLVHLSRQTLGDTALEQEVLALFVRQARVLMGRLRQATADADRHERLLLAHTLKGSARAVGAWQVAAAAERIETAADAGSMDDLAGRVDEALAAIATLRGASGGVGLVSAPAAG
jgi:HPt (histidine-containing phosphotransfer) domain-containing protein